MATVEGHMEALALGVSLAVCRGDMPQARALLRSLLAHEAYENISALARENGLPVSTFRNRQRRLRALLRAGILRDWGSR